MAHIETIPEHDAAGAVAALYERAASPDGSVDDVIKLHALNPESGQAHMELYISAMHRPSPLSRAEREIVATVVSCANGCAYCVAHHAAGLARLLPADRAGLVDTLRAGERTGLTPRELAMVTFARRLTKAPREIAEADISLLREAGLDDRAILDLTHAAGYFAYVNRMVLGLGATLEAKHRTNEPPTLSDAGRAALERVKARNPEADPLATLPDVDPAMIPRHIAIIMDGNGRWATERGLARIEGHRTGVQAVQNAVEACGRLGVEQLTLYSFSSENWKRPADEVEALMELYVRQLTEAREELVKRNIRFRQIGRRTDLPEAVQRQVADAERITAECTGPTLCLAVNYGARSEIVDAARSLAARVRDGALEPEGIDEALFADALYTADMPDPDLLIRTAGEMRVSNYLLWQISYAELHVVDDYWPDFRADHLYAAVREYARRSRRFGGLSG